MKKNFNCFIACAFGKEDVDSIYENVITKVLSELNIKPVRVDKTEHNENIDIKIIELIQTSKLCITDLTYARPSAYFEAGYAMGNGIPVIYTVRKDHFNSKENDIYGNYRVHFDLQMKNIIDWSSTTQTSTFEKRLRSRINHVIKPILKQLKTKEDEKIREQEFSSISVNQRISKIADLVSKYFISQQWEGVKGFEHSENPGAPFLKFIDRNNKRYCEIDYFQSVTENRFNRRGMRTYIVTKNYQQLLEKGVSIHFITFSLRSIPKFRLEKVYPEATHLISGKLLKFKTNDDVIFYHHYLSGEKSAENFLKELQNNMSII